MRFRILVLILIVLFSSLSLIGKEFKLIEMVK